MPGRDYAAANCGPRCTNRPENQLELKWRGFINEAKTALRSIEDGRLKIVDLALAACTIPKAGGERRYAEANGVYTLKRFAEDIGMEPATLRQWINIKHNVIDHIADYDNTRKGEFAAAFSTAKKLKAEGLKDPKKVKEAFKKERTRTTAGKRKSDPDHGVDNLIERARFIYNQVGKLDLDKIDLNKVKDLAKILSGAVALLR